MSILALLGLLTSSVMTAQVHLIILYMVITTQAIPAYEIEATDDVLLGEGFIVENGATFAIKTPGKVTIDSCVFQSGAKVKVEAGNVEFVGKFTAEKGSMVEFSQFVD